MNQRKLKLTILLSLCACSFFMGTCKLNAETSKPAQSQVAGEIKNIERKILDLVPDSIAKSITEGVAALEDARQDMSSSDNSIFSFIASRQVVFYSFLALLVWYVARFVWNIIF